MPQTDRQVLRALRRFAPLGVILAVLATGLFMGWHQYLTLDYLADARAGLKSTAADYGLLAALAYVCVYALAVSVAFPATWLLTLAGGFLYGVWIGGLLAALGATIGATVLFWAAQTAFGEALRARVANFAGKVARGFEANAFSYLLALRLAPVFPFFGDQYPASALQGAAPDLCRSDTAWHPARRTRLCVHWAGS